MQLASWESVLWPIVAMVAALYVPGALIAWLAGAARATQRSHGRVNVLAVFAWAPLISFIIATASGLVCARLHVRWGWLAYGLSSLVVAVVVAAVRLLIHRSWACFRAQPSGQRRTLAASASVFGVLLAAASISGRLIHAVPSPDQIMQNYDSIFHTNLVAYIAQTGNADALHALPPVRETYPIAFQQFAALGKLIDPAITAPAALMGAWLICAALVYPISMLYMVRTICGNHMVTNFMAPALVAVAGGFPFLLLDWGTLYSMFAAQTVMPVLIAATWQWATRDWNRGAGPCITGIAWILVGILAVSAGHFRVIMSYILLMIPLLIWWLVKAGAELKRRRGARALHIAVAAFFTLVIAVFAAGVAVFCHMYLRNNTRPISDHLNGGQAMPTDTLGSALWRALSGTPIDSRAVRMPVDWIMVALLVLAVIAAYALPRKHSVLRRNMTLWLGSYALLSFIVMACAGTHADWAKVVTALWYKDQRRPFASWGIVAITLICIGTLAFCNWWHNRMLTQVSEHTAPRSRQIMAHLPRTMLLIVTTVCVLFSPQANAMAQAVGQTAAFASNDQTHAMLTEDKYLLLKRLSQDVPQGEVIVSDPWNGSGFALAVGDREPYYAHLNMLWDEPHTYIASNMQNIATDPQVCTTLNEHDLYWYLDMGKPYVQNDPQHQVFEGMSSFDAKSSPYLHEVDRQGDAVLYRITGCAVH
ncbi:hypothetical protein D2E26_1378 [Bifidobacterium dolichotidis]|uniref:Uncharacterized protein n=1 Tax=Bifidobacterium dolichotidis TaxID=2306976 RepID=A0A430FKG9_9BIFI|nr:DUF6541 family protein [Bifidobacterium dolichotidis]RSX53336.1 hypothetical protein D2E26_1378 [Bifidobacterium dolichotidis]